MFNKIRNKIIHKRYVKRMKKNYHRPFGMVIDDYNKKKKPMSKHEKKVVKRIKKKAKMLKKGKS